MKCKDKEILYIDNHLLLLKKEAGILTQENGLKVLSLEEMAKNFLKKLLKKEKVFLHPVHRLDKVVSGLVLFARSSKALSRLNGDIRKRKIVRKYLAVVEGYLKEKEGVLEHDLLKLSHRSEVKEDKRSKRAILKYRVIEERNEKSLLEIELVTGRYHQIRAQLSFIGHPILGDGKYGSSLSLEEIFLHGVMLEFVHPVKKEKLKFVFKRDFDF
jgi:23S rRNA pseudouridine1911/1915/1917 synthase